MIRNCCYSVVPSFIIILSMLFGLEIINLFNDKGPWQPQQRSIEFCLKHRNCRIGSRAESIFDQITRSLNLGSYFLISQRFRCLLEMQKTR